ncbi:unnamed protein product [Heterosigma akashiwo]|mmetsp:Transcript_27663/g.43552  ORF Transcript_27663/g.43552 Transcript_27663/m.43552 type:complete len:218 (-) Transcript_27663:223-876(-)
MNKARFLTFCGGRFIQRESFVLRSSVDWKNGRYSPAQIPILHPSFLLKRRFYQNRFLLENMHSKSSTSKLSGEVAAKQDPMLNLTGWKKWKAQGKAMWKQYGVVATATWFGTYFITLGSFYAGFSSGLLDSKSWVGESSDKENNESNSFKFLDWFERFETLKPLVQQVKQSPRVQTFLLAWVATKFTEPVRMVIVVGVTPRIARALGYAAIKSAAKP